jgi:cellulose synthase/poly-beta-1,6-N-acetylglucosamine synthase-like glycosyltransferase
VTTFFRTRPVLSPWRAACAFAVALAVTLSALGSLAWAMCEPGGSSMVVGEVIHPLLAIAVFFIGYDVALGLVLIGTLVTSFRSAVRTTTVAEPPAVSVLIAAWNEVEALSDTVRRWAAQDGVRFEILVGDDGSTDGTVAGLVRDLGLARVGADSFAGDLDGVPVRVFSLPHGGKGATLNALAPHAQHAVLVTIDADTTPAPHALSLVARAFVDADVDVATGVVSIRNGRAGWLLANQSAEYLKNAWVRIAWSALGALEQVPGAFLGIRAPLFASAGGFPTDSLTEDYELTFRCLVHGLVLGRTPVVVVVPAAQVFTDGPGTVAGFIRQRTRWFAGFLTTLFRFRALIGRRGTGAFGLVRLPLKLVDAVLPAIAFASLVVLVSGGVHAAFGIMRVSIVLFAVRWVWDLFVYACATLSSDRLGSPEMSAAAAPPSLLGWVLTALEALTYVWFKHFAALRGIVWAVRRVQTWETSRHNERPDERRPSSPATPHE